MIKGQNRLVKIAQHGVHADPAPLRLAGQAPQNPTRDRRLDAQHPCAWAGRWSQWTAPSPNRTAKLVFIVALGFIRFVGESRPARWIELVEISRRPVPRRGYIPAKNAGTMS
jgi:hypothetical protein